MIEAGNSQLDEDDLVPGGSDQIDPVVADGSIAVSFAGDPPADLPAA